MLSKENLYFKGHTIVEIMVAITISCGLLLAVTNFITLNIRNLNQQLSHLELQHEVEKALSLIVKDIKRTGFQAVNERLNISNLSLFLLPDNGSINLGTVNGEATNSCVIFFYDLDHSGCIGGKYRTNSDDRTASCIKNSQNNVVNIHRELFGYRLRGNRLQWRVVSPKEILNNCTQPLCQSYSFPSRCNTGNWIDLLDKNLIAMDILKFNWVKHGKLKAVEISIQAHLVASPKIVYRSFAVVPLLNQT